MHIPTFGQVATLGMAFFAVAALAAPVAEPLEADLVERSADLATRGEGISAFTGSVNALEQRNSKKKCKRTNKKGNCTDSDSDSDNDHKKKNKNKKCKRNSKGDCSDSDSDNDKKNKKCKRNSKGKCEDNKKNDNKDDKKNNDKDNKGGYKGY
ncbi:hypothetical protein CH063_07762 [Colletotrichum higginsianum]|uniref:Uncharacterized protein n=2 Tax=Colletotrichum higginsianum TaxID=80884 RepID=H1V7C8_COLHI|nr:hypothetical protein CH63R_00096 [Colletotrichum higginsianum IMI 349063]OBR14916.1 hypothetical protein CH63R_00096 [Colletotrichum higginsianum IMI 349063]TID04093.1 hypothetical protein CH35J_003234 [Colletotrichum higginsianum]GJC92807.1 hypothetical protein ColKHC_01633 [Colletotrichum higginsianum]CCF36130.1 hypothetical protein CH063_07762 [Colletotrichum higginsianum]